MIKTMDLKTPGREEEEAAAEAGNADRAVSGYDIDAIFAGIGGRENIVTLDNCVTRLRLEVKDASLIDEALLKKAGSKGVIKTGANSVQVIIGTNVEHVAAAMKKKM